MSKKKRSLASYNQFAQDQFALGIADEFASEVYQSLEMAYNDVRGGEPYLSKPMPERVEDHGPLVLEAALQTVRSYLGLAMKTIEEAFAALKPSFFDNVGNEPREFGRAIGMVAALDIPVLVQRTSGMGGRGIGTAYVYRGSLASQGTHQWAEDYSWFPRQYGGDLWGIAGSPGYWNAYGGYPTTPFGRFHPEGRFSPGYPSDPRWGGSWHRAMLLWKDRPNLPPFIPSVELVETVAASGLVPNAEPEAPFNSTLLGRVLSPTLDQAIPVPTIRLHSGHHPVVPSDQKSVEEFVVAGNELGRGYVGDETVVSPGEVSLGVGFRAHPDAIDRMLESGEGGVEYLSEQPMGSTPYVLQDKPRSFIRELIFGVWR